MSNRGCTSLVLLAIAVGCADGRSDANGPAYATGAGGDGGAGGGVDDDGGSDGGPAADDGSGGGLKLDVGAPGGDGQGEGGGCGPDDPACSCEVVHVPCDAGTDKPLLAMGIGCAGETPADLDRRGSTQAFGVRHGFGANDTFAPREGATFAVIGSGRVSQLDSAPPGGDDTSAPTYCNEDLDGLDWPTDLGPFDPDALPAPLKAHAVGGDCLANPGLVGTGDCSSTIENQWKQGATARDYTELRASMTVPANVASLSYDFAFFSVEWPDYYGSEFNDMFVGWLDSESWTGNISFDAQGNPISLNAAFLELTGNAPALAGTCMQGHAGTRWLTSTAPVTPGEHITLVFAIMDLSDSVLDSYAFLDNFQWTCVPSDGPSTVPVG